MPEALPFVVSANVSRKIEATYREFCGGELSETNPDDLHVTRHAGQYAMLAVELCARMTDEVNRAAYRELFDRDWRDVDCVGGDEETVSDDVASRPTYRTHGDSVATVIAAPVSTAEFLARGT